MKSYIHFIRHGKTEGNLKSLYYGWTDLPLLEEGIEELKMQKELGIYPKCDGADCYTSGLLRTEQTFSTIYGDTPHKRIDLFKEINFGKWDGMSYEQIMLQPEFEEWKIKGENDFVYPEGESFATFRIRISKAIDELMSYHHLKESSCNDHGNDAVSIVVCHGGVISTVMDILFPDQKESTLDWIPDPGHGYTVFFEDSKPKSYAKF